MSHELLTIDNRLINELFDYILQLLAIRHYPKYTSRAFPICSDRLIALMGLFSGSMEKSDVGCGGVWGVHFYLKFEQKSGPQAQYNFSA